MNDAERHKLLAGLFERAIEIDDELLRAEFVDQIDADETVKEELRRLLSGFEGSKALFERPLADLNGGAASSGRVFGGYRIVREIGRGGMGSVFLAERVDEQVRHRAAVKILRQTFGSSDTERRFADERQILATLQHPNIAAFIDGGVGETGEPFITMEFVDGPPITQFARDKMLAVTERLRLFLKVCRAVAYAHRNLVVHRDIKPTNIIVNQDGEPKLLDFGLAKLTGLRDRDVTKTIFRALTPSYASPEQLKGEPITTSTDVYSLGVCLYELLTGRPPFDTENLSFEEVVNTVLTTDPAMPSRAVTREMKQFLSPRIGADLDNIVLMALRKEPERRYASVDEFARDIENYLDGQPVMARPNRLFYRVRKLVARNRAASAAILLLTVSLFAGLSSAVYQGHRAVVAQQRSDAQSARSDKISKFMEKVLGYANPSWYAEGHDQKGDARLIEVINALSDKIEAEFPDEPQIQAELHYKFAEIYQARRMEKQSLFHASRAYEIGRLAFGEKSPETAKFLYYLSAANFLRRHLNEGFEQAEKAFAIFDETDPANPNVPYLAEDLAGQYLSETQETARARELLGRAYRIFLERDGPDHYNTLRVFGQVAWLQAAEGNRSDAYTTLAETQRRISTLDSSQRSGFDFLEIKILRTLRDGERLKRRSREMFDDALRKTPPDFENATTLMFFLVGQLEAAGEMREAGELLEYGAGKMSMAVRGPKSTFSHLLLRSVYKARFGERAEARNLFNEALAVAPDEENRDQWSDDYLSGAFYLYLGEYRTAETYLQRTEEFAAKNFPPEQRSLLELRRMLATIAASRN